MLAKAKAEHGSKPYKENMIHLLYNVLLDHNEFIIISLCEIKVNVLCPYPSSGKST